MYHIVRRAFRDRFGMHTVGSIATEDNVRGLKYKISDGSVVMITAENYEMYEDYFRMKYALVIPEPNAENKVCVLLNTYEEKIEAAIVAEEKKITKKAAKSKAPTKAVAAKAASK